MRQAQVFMDGEGTAWLRRNAKKLPPKNDPVLEALKSYEIKPSNVLEVGCANGWRLDLLTEEYGCNTWGIDPAGQCPRPFHIEKGTAADLMGCFSEKQFDLLIYGWCLYLCDPEDYFLIAECGDHILQEAGFLVVYDFAAPAPIKVPYRHKKGLYSYHYDFSRLWLGNPAYSVYGRTFQDETCVTILRKNSAAAFGGLK